MGKKKFIEKKNSATFQLLARDSSSFPAASAGGAPLSDRIFVRVDNNPYSIRGLNDEDDSADDADEFPDGGDPSSIFADAPGDPDAEEKNFPPPWAARGSEGGTRKSLPDGIRKEILELGLPDDGYNYLLHLREIKNSGGGSSYYENSKAKLDRVPLDVKAYDASRLRINADDGGDSNSMYAVASKTVGVKVQRAVDPDVARLLDDSDLSKFGSDVEDLEEDFVVKANLSDDDDDDDDHVEEEELNDEVLEAGEMVQVEGLVGLGNNTYLPEEDNKHRDDEIGGSENPRIRRLLDDQFDLLTLGEYDDEDEPLDDEDEPLAARLNDSLKLYKMDDLELEDKYRVPGDVLHGHQGSSTGPELDRSSDVIHKCMEYAEKYYNESQNDEELVLVEESSDESEVWDCETIISTYSNLDNHPGKIQAPENPKKSDPKFPPRDSAKKSDVISLRGKEKLPVDFLPHNKRAIEKMKEQVSSGSDMLRRRPHGAESKEEKKERKAAVKEKRREARQTKKDFKGLYRSEAQKAQKVAAITGPSSIHLM